MTFVAMSAGQVLTVFNVRTDRGSGFRGASQNRWLWLAVATTGVPEAAALTFPPLRDVLGLTKSNHPSMTESRNRPPPNRGRTRVSNEPSTVQ